MKHYNVEQTELLDHLIEKYRKDIRLRYEYDVISQRFDLPGNLNRQVLEEIRKYFLSNIYPEAGRRHQLNEAFASLEDYINHPTKIWHLLGSMTAAIFRFGYHFPAALKAGFLTLDSFLKAKSFEHHMLEAAVKAQLTIPVSDEDFKHCLANVPQKDAEKFIHDVCILFQSMTDTALLKITIDILDNVIKKMKRLHDIYDEKNLNGILLGKETLQNGYDLFKNYDRNLKKAIIKIIRMNEEWYLSTIY